MQEIMVTVGGRGTLDFEYIPMSGTDAADQDKVLAEVQTYASNISPHLVASLVESTSLGRWLVRIEGPEADVNELAADWFGEDMEEVVS